MKIFTYDTSIGKLTITEEENAISKISFGNSLKGTIEETSLIKETYVKLCEYFSGQRKTFDIPLKLSGTDFQIKVWNALQKIPYGKTLSYKDIAQIINNPNAFRAVGNANNKNPIPIIIPCHRVIATDGDIGGYLGGSEIKKFLINIEKTNYNK